MKRYLMLFALMIAGLVAPNVSYADRDFVTYVIEGKWAVIYGTPAQKKQLVLIHQDIQWPGWRDGCNELTRKRLDQSMTFWSQTPISRVFIGDLRSLDVFQKAAKKLRAFEILKEPIL